MCLALLLADADPPKSRPAVGAAVGAVLETFNAERNAAAEPHSEHAQDEAGQPLDCPGLGLHSGCRHLVAHRALDRDWVHVLLEVIHAGDYCRHVPVV